MMSILLTLVHGLFILSWGAAFVSFAGAVFYFLMTLRYRKTDAQLMQLGWNPVKVAENRGNPFSALLVPELLTAPGLETRRRSWSCALGFVVAIVVACFLGGLTWLVGSLV